jgi:tetratricopeptide (TPR) repeat protein
MPDAMEQFIIGVDAFKNGDVEKAIKHLESSTHLDSKNHKAFAYLGAAYAAMNRYNEAIGAFKVSEQLSPGVASIHYNIAQAYEAAGVFGEAEYEYKRALKVDHKYIKAADALKLLETRMMNVITMCVEHGSSDSETPADNLPTA